MRKNQSRRNFHTCVYDELVFFNALVQLFIAFFFIYIFMSRYEILLHNKRIRK